MKNAVAIVGMACRYPEARSPAELWENVLAGRRAFRRMPAERLRLEDYYSPDAGVPDRIYSTQAAVLEGYEFDRLRFRVGGNSFRSADLTHWLALDVAADTLADAGYPEASGLPRESAGVLVGNSLTGEFVRANLMRLRWPYVRRVVESALNEEGWEKERSAGFLDRLEATYKTPYPPITEESLAGGLSNTIAGRIANHFDLGGGAYTVDGACSSSLLAVAQAASALVAGDLDIALAGGVDLSLDPFELVGFAKTRALAVDEMRVYDARSAGFWPGEGCGMVALMRLEDAQAEGRPIHAVLRGWGISSDGKGGLTRPKEGGQLLALRRAYARAGFGVDSVGYFEGHGTGTAVGDATELRVLSRARRESGAREPAVLSSIKANIGHTKAAAGAAGMIKAVMALKRRVLPPHVSVSEPHPELAGDSPALRLLSQAEPWPEGPTPRAAVSAMGFGGINAHVVLEGVASPTRVELDSFETSLLYSAQDTELFLLAAGGVVELLARLDELVDLSGTLSWAQLSDLAAELVRRLAPGQVRCAVLASRPEELSRRLAVLAERLRSGILDEGGRLLDLREGFFASGAAGTPRIGFLFPGQGEPAHLDGGILRRRFLPVERLYERVALPTSGDGVHTAVAQPAIATASIAGLKVLETFAVAGPADRLHLPGLQHDPSPDGLRERGAPPDLSGHAGSGEPGARLRSARPGGAQPSQAPLPPPALGGTATARRGGASHRRPAALAPRRRAHREPRLGQRHGRDGAPRRVVRGRRDDLHGDPRRAVRPPGEAQRRALRRRDPGRKPCRGMVRGRAERSRLTRECDPRRRMNR